ncbi:MAG: S8 family serine peptidase, partial [Myxococcota bacterium]
MRWWGVCGALAGVLGVMVPAFAGEGAHQGRVAGRLVVRERAGLSVDALYDTLARSGARRVDGLGAVGATVIEVAEADLPAIEAVLRRSGVFRSVERDYLAKIAEEPNDTYYVAQWGLPRTGVPEAWELSDGSGVLVAVIDTGVEATHPDLQGQIVTGYDFLNDDGDPRDDNGHGTRMAGIVAARGHNALGVIGVAPQARVLSVKALDGQGYGPYSAVAKGMLYAVDQGAKVLSLSLSGATNSATLLDAVNYAKAHEVVVVAASGNYGSDIPNYPAATSGAVAIAALNSADQRPIFSNYGAWISVAAPGDDVVTTTLNGGYSSSTGTSPAAAFTAGIFALLSSAN